MVVNICGGVMAQISNGDLYSSGILRFTVYDVITSLSGIIASEITKDFGNRKLEIKKFSILHLLMCTVFGILIYLVLHANLLCYRGKRVYPPHSQRMVLLIQSRS